VHKAFSIFHTGCNTSALTRSRSSSHIGGHATAEQLGHRVQAIPFRRAMRGCFSALIIDADECPSITKSGHFSSMYEVDPIIWTKFGTP
jgi:hypothetical protein